MNTSTLLRASQVVTAFIDAINREDFDTGRSLADDQMTFVGVLGSRNGADAYFSDMQKMKLKYKVQKVLADEQDVCVFYDLDIAGKTIFGCGWYKVGNGKVTSLKVLFDPRPLLEEQKK